MTNYLWKQFILLLINFFERQSFEIKLLTSVVEYNMQKLPMMQLFYLPLSLWVLNADDGLNFPRLEKETTQNKTKTTTNKNQQIKQKHI